MKNIFPAIRQSRSSMPDCFCGNRLINLRYGFCVSLWNRRTLDERCSCAGSGHRRIHAGRKKDEGRPFSTRSIKHAFMNLAKSNHSAAETLSLLFTMVKITPAKLLSVRLSTCVSEPTPPSTFFAQLLNTAFSPGPKTLAELASETGGSVFYDDASEVVINNNLRTIEAKLRNQYRLIYDPAESKRNGSFHKLS